METEHDHAEDHAVEVLLVEDNPSDAELALRALKKNKLTNHVRWLQDGAAAIDYLFGEGEWKGRELEPRPRVILLDLKLPKVDGIEVLRRVKSDDRTRSIPVVVMTSSREERDIVDSYRLGVNSYVVKPVDFDQFSKAVGELGFYWMLINQPPIARAAP